MPSDFLYRHIGPKKKEIQEMLSYLGFSSLDDMTDKILPEEIL